VLPEFLPASTVTDGTVVARLLPEHVRWTEIECRRSRRRRGRHEDQEVIRKWGARARRPRLRPRSRSWNTNTRPVEGSPRCWELRDAPVRATCMGAYPLGLEILLLDAGLLACEACPC